MIDDLRLPIGETRLIGNWKTAIGNMLT